MLDMYVAKLFLRVPVPLPLIVPEKSLGAVAVASPSLRMMITLCEFGKCFLVGQRARTVPHRLRRHSRSIRRPLASKPAQPLLPPTACTSLDAEFKVVAVSEVL